MSDIPHETRADASVAQAPEPFVRRNWLPQAIVGIGLGVTVVWICILAYGFVKLVELLI